MLKRLFGKSSASNVAAPVKANVEAEKPKNAPATPQTKSTTSPASASPKPRAKRQPKAQKPWSIDEYVVPVQEGKKRFHDLNLPLSLMRGIAELGYEYCSPIQAQVLPYTLDGYDAIGKAQTGTGKTAAFLITVITDLLNKPVEGSRYIGEPRALVIAPTRELVQQIADDAKNLCKYTDLHVVNLIGGVDYERQLRQLEDRAVDIVVATPGRLMDFKERGHVYLDQVEIMVIDEADRMLDMGFIPQVKRIISHTPKKTQRQTLLFSATFTPDILNLSERWTHEPVRVEIEPESVAADTVEQIVYIVSADEKFALLKKCISEEKAESVIIFANRRDTTRKLHERLLKAGFKAGILSGDIPQNKRSRTLEDFKAGKLKVLVATDVAGRGIHIDGISHVINYTLPEDPEDYVHRIGRTGRAGAQGVSISFACEDDAFMLPSIEELLGRKLNAVLPPEDLLG
ncbi:MAG TPA: ATP-dependent RNA helicase RhlB [Pseudomonadales bacterium]|nr:ATP-dependent RNA helicase RhlB [Pseudomonadales bacterium]